VRVMWQGERMWWQGGVVGQGDMKIVEVTWSVSGGQMSGGERGRKDNGKGQACGSCEWRTGVSGSGRYGRQSGSLLGGGVGSKR
jgi:hypothetical protein